MSLVVLLGALAQTLPGPFRAGECCVRKYQGAPAEATQRTTFPNADVSLDIPPVLARVVAVHILTISLACGAGGTDDARRNDAAPLLVGPEIDGILPPPATEQEALNELRGLASSAASATRTTPWTAA